MRPGNLIKHERYLDIYLRLVKVFDYGHGYEIKAEVWNMAYIESYNTGEKIRLNMAKDQKDLKAKAGRNTHLGEWLIARPSDITCQRYAEWRKIK